MKSYQLTELGEPLELVETDTPEPTGTQVLLKTIACGVCHSDVHLWHGGFDLGGGKFMSLTERGMTLPMVMGHEPIGEVVAVGPDAHGVSMGETRLVFPWIGCGTCARCGEEHDNDCTSMRTIGVFRPGGYADHVLAPHPKYLIDISGIDPVYGCTLACAGVTAYSALSKTLPLADDDKVVIIGAGGVGLTGVGIAPGFLEREVIVVDIEDEKLRTARETGANHTVNSSAGNAVEEIHDLTAGGAGAVVDFVGAPQTAHLGMDAIRKGGKYVAVGLYGGEVSVSMPLLPLRHMSLRGSYVGNLAEMRELAALAQAGKVKALPVQTRPMSEVTRTLRELESGDVTGRVIVVP